MQPSLAKNRLEAIDVLRGAALPGILLAHFTLWHTAGPLPSDVLMAYNHISHKAVTSFTNIFVTGKFFTFFSFLFGLGFYLQLSSAGRRNKNFLYQYAWRLLLLLCIGLAHHTFWAGDILLVYVPIGFMLMLLRRLPVKYLLVTSLILAINLPGKMLHLIHEQTGMFASSIDLQAYGIAYHEVISQGSWLHIFSFNLQNLYAKFEFQLLSGRLFISLGFCLLGMYVGRRKWLEQMDASKVIIRSIFARSAAISAICLALFLLLNAAHKMLPATLKKHVFSLISITYDCMSAAMTIAIISGLLLLRFRHRWKKLLQPLAAVGKMTLTIYLMQTLAGLLLFYNVGLGLYAKTSPATNYLIAFVLFMVQVGFSNWWMRHFRYGPVEWLWRSGTLLQWQALRRKQYKYASVTANRLHGGDADQWKEAV